jgi:DNA-binding MarR family transcriptional regulator
MSEERREGLWEEDEEFEGQEEEYEVRDRRLVGYFWIESAIIETYGAELGPYGIATYNVLACRANNRTNQTFVSAEYIAAHAGMSDKQVYRMLDKLEDLGLIVIERRSGRSHLITLTLVEKNEKKAAQQRKR